MCIFLGLLTSSTQTAVILAQQKGASAWLGTLPIEEHGLALHKGAFRDALALRYGWQPNGLPATCACGKANNVQHVLSCMKGGLPIHRHNDIRDLTASLMEEVSTSTETEPALQPLSGEMMHGLSANIQDDSRVDIRCRGFWNPQQDAFFDVRHLPIRPPRSVQSSRGMNDSREEHTTNESGKSNMAHSHLSSSWPLVEWGPSTTIAYKWLAALLAEKRGQRYSLVMTWLRCRLSFSLLRSAITAIRGSRTVRFNRESTQQIELAAAEGRIPST